MTYATLILLVAFQQSPQIIGPIGLAPLLKDVGVRKELGVSAEQARRLDFLSAEMNGEVLLPRRVEKPGQGKVQDGPSFAARQRDVASALTPEQLKRFVQIQIQYNGAVAFTTQSIQSALDLTDEQKAQHKRILAEMNRLIGQVREEITLEKRKRLATGGLKPEADRKLSREMMDRRAEQWRKCFRKAHSLLTEEQKAIWKELTGEPFEGAEFGPHREAPMNRIGFSGR